MPEPDERSSFAEAMRKVAPFLNLGTTFAVTVGLGTAAGWWMDARFHTSPWLLLVGIFLGLAAAFVGFFRTVLPRKGGGGDR
jgi:F0F1-type ATP synthase assembly protein I